jgi:uncharacterized RDD family membrane protein YckC
MSSLARERAVGPAPIELVTPEHVPLRFNLADPGARVGALLIDLLGVVALILVILVPMALTQALSGALSAFFLLAFFVVRNFYFTLAESHWQGRTVGKKRLGLRVVARDGGPLTGDQVFARNLTRDIEIFVPLSVLLAPESLIPHAPAWVTLALVVWVLALACLPFCNRHRARLGDLIAGTIVIAEPQADLDFDLVELDPLRRVEEIAAYTFTPAHLGIYGIRELQVLEDALRRPPADTRDQLLAAIAKKIQRKIDWPEDESEVDTPLFLQAFYTAQRTHLEQKMLFGDRRERKVR